MAETKQYRGTVQLNSAPPQNAKTQTARILRLLMDARGAWVPLFEIMSCAAQYNARLWSLRRLGFQIENKTQRDDSGVVHSWYRLVSPPAPPTPGLVEEKPTPANSATSTTDWYERAVGKPRPSAGKSDLPLFDRGVQP
jgi:hypothetical protein